ncbi:hypothetical protein DPMN_033211 [Dreissena polymorpha]|uniref:CARD domain-containing protein n=2 Tax=Dreissena polymorpha TaxID=45954 RepID=A0A9D4RKS1_DREPO|nr:hypothetical protein DPMN_033211 [Dreissena polymorpha]
MEKVIGLHGKAITELQDIVRMLSNTKKPKPKKKKCFSPTKAGPPSVELDLSKLVHMQEALRVNFSLFRDLCLDDGHILDRLLECDCICLDEYQDIRSRHTNNEQFRVLLFKLRNRAPYIINIFLNVIHEDPAYEELYFKFSASLCQITNENRHRTKCAVCVLKATVDIKDIVDALWSAKIISDEIFERVVDQDNSYTLKTLFWENIANSMRDSEEKKKQVIESLEAKYAYLYPGLKDKQGRLLSLECCYCRYQRPQIRERKTDLYGSVSDMSTTSEYVANYGTDSYPSSICVDSGDDCFDDDYDDVSYRVQSRSATIRMKQRRDKIQLANTLLRTFSVADIDKMSGDDELNNWNSDEQRDNHVEAVAEIREGNSQKDSSRQNVQFNIAKNRVRTHLWKKSHWNLLVDHSHRSFSDAATQTDVVGHACCISSKRIYQTVYKHDQYKEDTARMNEEIVAGAWTVFCDNSATSNKTDTIDVHQQCHTDTSHTAKKLIHRAPVRRPSCLKLKCDKPDSASNVKALISLFNKEDTGMLDLSGTQT